MAAASPFSMARSRRGVSVGYTGLAEPRRVGQWLLGLIWLLDAALQFQPYMFTRQFAQQVLAPTGPGNPGWIAHPVHWSAQLTVHHSVLLNTVYAVVQLLIALGIFLRRTVRAALAGSVIWSLLVWWLGEGLGGVLAGPQSPLAGSPGAVILYAMLAVLLWPRDRRSARTVDGTSVATSSPLGATGARMAWVVLFGAFTYEMTQRANQDLHGLFAGNVDGEPGWLQSIDRGFASATDGHGLVISLVLAGVFAAIAVAVFAPPSALRLALVVLVLLSLAIWFAGEDIGEIATGTATDPNSGLLLALLALVYWPLRRA